MRVHKKNQPKKPHKAYFLSLARFPNRGFITWRIKMSTFLINDFQAFLDWGLHTDEVSLQRPKPPPGAQRHISQVKIN